MAITAIDADKTANRVSFDIRWLIMGIFSADLAVSSDLGTAQLPVDSIG
jgi:hypothetical protein